MDSWCPVKGGKKVACEYGPEAAELIRKARADALEEAARVADTATFPSEDGLNFLEIAIVKGGRKAAENIATTIRSLKDKP